jgi:hypothetical protein
MFIGEMRLDGALSIVEVPEDHHTVTLWRWATHGLPTDRILLLSLEGHRRELEESYELMGLVGERLEEMGVPRKNDEPVLPVPMHVIDFTPRLTVLVMLLPALTVPCEELCFA